MPPPLSRHHHHHHHHHHRIIFTTNHSSLLIVIIIVIIIIIAIIAITLILPVGTSLELLFISLPSSCFWLSFFEDKHLIITPPLWLLLLILQLAEKDLHLLTRLKSLRLPLDTDDMRHLGVAICFQEERGS